MQKKIEDMERGTLRIEQAATSHLAASIIETRGYAMEQSDFIEKKESQRRIKKFRKKLKRIDCQYSAKDLIKGSKGNYCFSEEAVKLLIQLGTMLRLEPEIIKRKRRKQVVFRNENRHLVLILVVDKRGKSFSTLCEEHLYDEHIKGKEVVLAKEEGSFFYFPAINTLEDGRITKKPIWASIFSYNCEEAPDTENGIRHGNDEVCHTTGCKFVNSHNLLKRCAKVNVLMNKPFITETRGTEGKFRFTGKYLNEYVYPSRDGVFPFGEYAKELKQNGHKVKYYENGRQVDQYHTAILLEGCVFYKDIKELRVTSPKLSDEKQMYRSIDELESRLLGQWRHDPMISCETFYDYYLLMEWMFFETVSDMDYYEEKMETIAEKELGMDRNIVDYYGITEEKWMKTAAALKGTGAVSSVNAV